MEIGADGKVTALGRGEAAQMQVRNKAGERPVGRDVSQLEPTQALTADAAGPSYY
ncbi:MAG: hypothetical protein JWN44_2122, partial [Myxococcales bacterium]|nr:hypothetical protein [Myxococcales bacterium]